MGSGMPYHREKAETWETFDSFFSHVDVNIRARHKLATLEHLWSPQPVGDFTAMAEPGSPATPYVTDHGLASGLIWQKWFGKLVYHANVDWFGYGIPADNNGNPVTALNPGPTANYYPSTTPKPEFGVGPGQVLSNGWWKNWYGEDTEAIVCQGYIRAIEVSLGLSHPDDASITSAQNDWTTAGGEMVGRLYPDVIARDGPSWQATLAGTDDPSSSAFHRLSARFPRNWPIEFWWTCGFSWFQAWISWSQGATRPPRPAGVNDGRVVVTWMTPGSPLHTIYRDLTNLPRAQAKAVGAGIPSMYADDRFGSWMIAHERNDVVNNLSYYPTFAGVNWPLPVPTNYSYGPVVAIEPPYADGGVTQPVAMPVGFGDF